MSPTEERSSGSSSAPPPPRKQTAGQRVWRFLCDLIPDAENPKWNPDAPTVEATEARLTTDAQRQRRAELVKALQIASALDDAGPKSAKKDDDEKQDPRLTVQLSSLDEESLVAPELFHHTVNRGFVQLIQAGDKVTTIFSHGVGTQAYAKRQAIAEGMDVQTRNMLRTVVRLRSDKEYETAVQRARQRGYRFTVVTLLTIVVLLSCVSSPAYAATVRRADASQMSTSHRVQPKIVDVLALSSNVHLALVDKDSIASHHLHAIAVPRQHAVGMWLPSVSAQSLMSRHRNSHSYRRAGHADASVAPSSESALHTAVRVTTKRWVDVPDFFSGTQNETAELLSGQGYNVSRLLADTQTTVFEPPPPQRRSVDGTFVKHLVEPIEKRVNPFLIKAAIVAGGFIAETLFTAACQVASTALNFKTVGMFICFGGAFVISALGTFGSLFTYSKILRGASTSGQAYRLSEVATGGISIVQASLHTRSEDAMWFEAHMDMLHAMYADSLVHDQYLRRTGTMHHDATTGQELTVWDMLMSHVHPIRHAFVAGLNSTLWHESSRDALRHHSYTALRQGASTGSTAAHFNVSWSDQDIIMGSPSPLRRRQCAESDTETDYEEAASEDWCETGTADGPEGVYNGYQFSGNEDEADSAHLKLGNDSYAWEMAKLEGALAYLGGYNGVCETLQYDGGPTFYMGLREIERTGDQYAGFSSCQQ